MTKRTNRPVLRLGDIGLVPLQNGLLAVIDADDIDLVGPLSWRSRRSRGVCYVVANLPRSPAGRGEITLHRLILPTAPGLVVDHIDGDTLNNRKSNLRAATSAENCRNRGPQSNNKTGFKGVYLSGDGKYVARIRANRKAYHLGEFMDAQSAHAAYCVAAADLHGEFARHS